jgi:hypothetical protein
MRFIVDAKLEQLGVFRSPVIVNLGYGASILVFLRDLLGDDKLIMQTELRSEDRTLKLADFGQQVSDFLNVRYELHIANRLWGHVTFY